MAQITIHIHEQPLVSARKSVVPGSNYYVLTIYSPHDDVTFFLDDLGQLTQLAEDLTKQVAQLVGKQIPNDQISEAFNTNNSNLFTAEGSAQ